MKQPAVFVASSAEGLPLARELRHQLDADAEVTLWSAGAFQPGQTPAESLADIADRCDFAVFVFTRDDYGVTPEQRVDLRDNLLFEIGFLTARLGAKRTFVIADNRSPRLPTDIAGIECVPFVLDSSRSPEALIAPAVAVLRRAFRALNVRNDRVASFYSCFISYSWKDMDFVTQLHDDLEEVGVQCWLDAKDMRIGESVSQQIDRAIQQQDKVLLILSHSSVRSNWVRTEVDNILRREHDRKGSMLFPLRLDDDVFDTPGMPQLQRLRDRHILDFTDWRDTSSYRRAFRRLVRDLSINASVDSEGSRQ